ncbi:MAG: DNA polymerase III subunit gamma/tau [Bacteroidetes bacterium]|nr:DNA polymerase III subunit gamma/tau [Bacteroidota bacterium]
MENFVVSARKYRPATFNTVVGQSSITNTLKNAIRNNHLAQSFLFCGPRGVGKTTCARILAKTINCTNLTKETEACDKCENCTSFNSGQTMNVFELDAASNNGVEDIRNLVDQVRIPPQMGMYKVYIIDEVHMLSAGAFNAFLKTLEEPPKYAIFILATTERHKIIPTILSRCQVFNFNRIQIDDIANHLAFIAKNENVKAEQDALHIIAQKADGALRDACSIFDQVVSFSGNELTYKNVIENLNVLDYDYYFKAVDLLLAENIPGTLLLFNEILSNGFDGHNFISGMAEHFRNLLVCKDQQTLELLEVGQNIREKYKVQSVNCSVDFLLRALGLTNKCDVAYRSSRNPRLLVEFCLMQLTAINRVTATAEKKNDDPELIFGTRAAGSPKKKAAIPLTDNIPEAEKVQPVVLQHKQEAEPPAETQTTSRKINLRATSSIAGMLNASQEKTEKKVVEEIKTGGVQQDFSQEELEKVWKSYAGFLRNKGKESDYAFLTMNKPVKVNAALISFTVFNKAAETNINEDKTELMGYLRRMLKNNSFNLEIIVTKDESGSKIYTSADKYKHFVKINPALDKLRTQFDLDVEY